MTRPGTSVTTAVTPSSPDRPPTIWPSVPYPDPQAAIDFLVQTFGFEPTALIPGDQPGSYDEIELRWPYGSGGIIIRAWDRSAPNWLYVVTPRPDDLYHRAKAAGPEDHPGDRRHQLRQPHLHCRGSLVGQLELRHLPRQLTAGTALNTRPPGSTARPAAKHKNPRLALPPTRSLTGRNRYPIIWYTPRRQLPNAQIWAGCCQAWIWAGPCRPPDRRACPAA